MSTLATESAGSAETISLPLELTPEQAELRARARRFVDDRVLIPLEEEAERLHGRLPQETIDLIKRAAIEASLNGGLHSPEYGGQGWTRMEWALVEEQFGRSTNGVYWHIPNAYNVWDHASRGQRERYLRPAIAGELKDAYAVTEAEAGSDPSRIVDPGRAHRRRLPDQRREVVRDLRRRRAGADRDGERGRRRRPPADPVPGRERRAGGRVRR